MSSTPDEEWSVHGITFDTAGWALQSSSSSHMTWSAVAAELTLTREDQPVEHPAVSLTVIRDRVRAHARANEEDIVSVDRKVTAGGERVQTILKRRRGPGHAYRGELHIRAGSEGFRVVSEMNEGSFTGIREATVTAMLAQCGELRLGVSKPDGSRSIDGWAFDPYDATFDTGALNTLSDDERVDIVVPGHPLSRMRRLLRTIDSSLVFTERNVTTAEGSPHEDDAEADSARTVRRQLSPRVARAILGATRQHNDLVEQSLREEIAALGDTPGAQLALTLLEFTMFLQRRDRAAEAVPVAARAAAMCEDFLGGRTLQTIAARTYQGYALFKVGREDEALPILLAAIEFFEDEPVDKMTYALALNAAMQILDKQGRTQLAEDYVERLQRLIAEIAPPASQQ